MDIASLSATYERDGYVGGVPILTPDAAADKTVLDIVESMIGPDILLYNVTYIIKEANAPSHVSWHQDLT